MIHIYCDGGLGNRLLSAASAMYFSRQVGQEFVLHWPANTWYGCNLSDIIANEYRQSDNDLQVLDRDIIKDCLLLIHEDQIRHQNKKIIFNRNLKKDVMLKYFQNENVFYYSNGIHSSLTEEDIAPIFSELKLPKSVSARIDLYDIAECIGIHIRKTDYGRGLYMTVDDLKKTVDCSNEKFFVCSDDKTVENEFEKYANVTTFKKEFYACKLDKNKGWNEIIQDDMGRSFNCNIKRDKGSSIDAFCDMVLLSRTKKRLKTSGSSFLVCAEAMSKGGKL